MEPSRMVRCQVILPEPSLGMTIERKLWCLWRFRVKASDQIGMTMPMPLSTDKLLHRVTYLSSE